MASGAPAVDSRGPWTRTGRGTGRLVAWGRAHAQQLALAILLLAQWAYVAVRSVEVAFTNDESISWMIINGNAVLAQTANNQWLNTWLMRPAHSLFGQAEWALRLPNVLSFGIYAAACAMLVFSLRHPAARAVAVAGLLLDPFLIEFFGLARGYGLSLAFTAAALAALLVGPRPANARQLLLRLALVEVFGGLAFYANFSAAFDLLPIIGALLAEAVVRAVNGRLRFRAWLGAGVIVELAVLYWAMRPGIAALQMLRQTGQLYYGGQAGFVHDTIGSLVQTFGYSYGYHVPLPIWAAILAWVAVAAAGFGLLVAVVRLVTERHAGNLHVAGIVLFGAVAAAVVEHHLLDGLYPLDRTALGFLLAFTMFIAFAVDELAAAVRWSWARRALVPAGLVLLLGALVNFGRTLNTTSALTWTSDASDRSVMLAVANLVHRLGRPAHPWVLALPFPRVNTEAYYQARDAVSSVALAQLNPGDHGGDLYVVPPGTPAWLLHGTRLVQTLAPDGTQLRAIDDLPR